MDDGTALAATSVSTKQPTNYQVLAESCEWCLVENPWTGDEDDDDLIDTADVNSSTPTAQHPNQAATTAKRLNVNTPSSPFGKMFGGGKSGATSSRKTLGARMI